MVLGRRLVCGSQSTLSVSTPAKCFQLLGGNRQETGKHGINQSHRFNGERGDLNRGLSVSYLTSRFMQDLSIIDKDQTVNDIASRIKAFGERVLCPRDGRPGAAFVDVVADPHAGTANYLLSYTWAYKVSDIVSALSGFCRRGNHASTGARFWICCLCINQSRVVEMQSRGEKVPFLDFKDTFSARVEQIKNVVAMLSPWDEPENLKRLWCAFEIHYAIETPGCTLDLILPDDQWNAFNTFVLDLYRPGELYMEPYSFVEVVNKFSNVRVQDAVATYGDDHTNILSIIAPDVVLEDHEALSRACESHNCIIIRKLREWLVSTMKCQADAMLAALAADGKDDIVEFLVMMFVRVLFTFGQHTEAINLLETYPPSTHLQHSNSLLCLGVWCLFDAHLNQHSRSGCERRYHGRPALKQGIDRFLNFAASDIDLMLPGTLEHTRARLGYHWITHGDSATNEAMAFLQEVKERFEHLQHIHTLDYPVVLLAIGICHSHWDQHDQAMVLFENSLACVNEIGCEVNSLALYHELLSRISQQHHCLGHDDEAARILRNSRRSFRAQHSCTFDLSFQLLKQGSIDCGFGDSTPALTPVNTRKCLPLFNRSAKSAFGKKHRWRDGMKYARNLCM